MPMDFVYTTTKETRPVFHVLYRCPRAEEIEKANKVKAKPPAAENRVPCPVCLQTLTDWLKEVRTDFS